jgi:hypothetical protein
VRITVTRIVPLVIVPLIVAACSNSHTSAPPGTANPATTPSVATSSTTAAASTGVPSTVTTSPATTIVGAVDPNRPEVVEPGDIPDNQAFVRFSPAAGLYSVRVPEGWARTVTATSVTFTDKYNSITITTQAGTAPTVASVTASGLADVSADPTFKLIDVSPVTRKAGPGVLARYEIGSAPNAVTGKKALLAVERYVFFHAGMQVTLNLSGAQGADNVDPWRTVTDSLSWT